MRGPLAGITRTPPVPEALEVDDVTGGAAYLYILTSLSTVSASRRVVCTPTLRALFSLRRSRIPTVLLWRRPSVLLRLRPPFPRRRRTSLFPRSSCRRPCRRPTRPWHRRALLCRPRTSLSWDRRAPRGRRCRRRARRRRP